MGSIYFETPYICIYIYIYIFVFFSPVNPESEIIQSGQSKYSNFEYLNIPGKELNVTDISSNSLKKQNKIRSL